MNYSYMHLLFTFLFIGFTFCQTVQAQAGTINTRFYAGPETINPSQVGTSGNFQLLEAGAERFGVLESGLLSGEPIGFITQSGNDWSNSNKAEATAFFSLQQTFKTYEDLFGSSDIDGMPVMLFKVGAAAGTEYLEPGTLDIFCPDRDEEENDCLSYPNHTILFSTVLNTETTDFGEEDDYNSLDIIGHEFTHRFLIAEGWSKNFSSSNRENDGIVEGYCDIMGQMVEWYFEKER